MRYFLLIKKYNDAKINDTNKSAKIGGIEKTFPIVNALKSIPFNTAPII